MKIPPSPPVTEVKFWASGVTAAEKARVMPAR